MIKYYGDITTLDSLLDDKKYYEKALLKIAFQKYICDLDNKTNYNWKYLFDIIKRKIKGMI